MRRGKSAFAGDASICQMATFDTASPILQALHSKTIGSVARLAQSDLEWQAGGSTELAEASSPYDPTVTFVV